MKNKQVKLMILGPLNASHPHFPHFGYFFKSGDGLGVCGYGGSPPDDFYEYSGKVTYLIPVSLTAEQMEK